MSAGTATPFPRLDCTHEEADDSMMFHDCARHFKSAVGTHNHNTVSYQATPMYLYAYYTISQSIGEILASKISGSFAIQGYTTTP